MPVTDTHPSKASWAEEVENVNGAGLPATTTSAPDADGIRTIVEWRINEQGRKQKVTRRIRTKKVVTRVNTSCAARKRWKKFGAAANDPPGPDLGTTSIGEELFLKLASKQKTTAATTEKPSVSDEEGAAGDEKKATGPKMVVCRICKGDHWTLRCPYKDTLQPLAQLTLEKDGTSVGNGTSGDARSSDKYVPPSKRGLGIPGAGTSMTPDTYTLRVTNLSEDVTERDLHDLFRRFGHISRVYLAKDRVTSLSKGFAFVNYETKRSGDEAIAAMHGYGFHSLILSVEWAKPLEKD